MDMVYLDNSATTMPCKESIEAINTCLKDTWGNPSSLHSLGFEAENVMEDARKTVAKYINCSEKEIYFTSCGTESNNTAILGAARRRKKQGKRIVTSAIEHSSVLESMKLLENEGFEVVYLKPDKNGNITKEQIENAIDENTVLVSLMLVNNEIGSVLPIECVKDIVKQKKSPALIHCDAVQGFGKIPINVKSLGVDMLTASGHKIHAVKGIGFLYIKQGVSINPLILGGGQEKGMRSGTESVPLIASLSAAIKALPNLKTQLEIQQELLSYAKQKLNDLEDIKINSPENALPYILNISVLGFRSETLLHFLENIDIFVSSGSACSKGKGSYVLNEMGLEKQIADSALRISFSRFNTKEDIDKLVSGINSAIAKLRKAR